MTLNLFMSFIVINLKINFRRVLEMGNKKTLYKGTLEGTATSTFFGRCFVFKPDQKIEGIPEELIIVLTKLWTVYNGIANINQQVAGTYVRPGDKIFVDGEIVEEPLIKDDLPTIRMQAKIIYNKTLKCGFKG